MGKKDYGVIFGGGNLLKVDFKGFEEFAKLHVILNLFQNLKISKIPKRVRNDVLVKQWSEKVFTPWAYLSNIKDIQIKQWLENTFTPVIQNFVKRTKKFVILNLFQNLQIFCVSLYAELFRNLPIKKILK